MSNVVSCWASETQHPISKKRSRDLPNNFNIFDNININQLLNRQSFFKNIFRGGLTITTLTALSACTGGMVAHIMPGQSVTVHGVPFTVTDTARDATVRNFETGFTDPDLLLSYAATAAQRVTGCSVTTITKDTGVNTYRAVLECPV